METSENDSLLLSVIEAYCSTSVNSGTALSGLNTLLTKARHSISTTGIIFIYLHCKIIVSRRLGTPNSGHPDPQTSPSISGQANHSLDHSHIPVSPVQSNHNTSHLDL